MSFDFQTSFLIGIAIGVLALVVGRCWHRGGRLWEMFWLAFILGVLLPLLVVLSVALVVVLVPLFLLGVLFVVLGCRLIFLWLEDK